MRIENLPEKAFYLSSYPRSGNTWMVNSLCLLFNAMRGEALSTFHLYSHKYYLSSNEEFYIKTESEIETDRPLVIKTHESYDLYERLFPKKKCIYVLRDGRDALLSYYFFRKLHSNRHDVVYERIVDKRVINVRTSTPVEFVADEFEQFLKEYAAEWAEHVSKWLQCQDVLVVRYEDIHKDFAGILRGVIDYLQIDLAATIEEVMDQFTGKFRKYFSRDNKGVYRKGIVGDWKEHYSRQHLAAFEERAGKVLKQVYPEVKF